MQMSQRLKFTESLQKNIKKIKSFNSAKDLNQQRRLNENQLKANALPGDKGREFSDSFYEMTSEFESSIMKQPR